jgi:hypothetical protein
MCIATLAAFATIHPSYYTDSFNLHLYAQLPGLLWLPSIHHIIQILLTPNYMHSYFGCYTGPYTTYYTAASNAGIDIYLVRSLEKGIIFDQIQVF